MRGPFTGKGYNLGIIDDPYKGQEDAKSVLQRERLIDWLKSVWFTRAEAAIAEPDAISMPIPDTCKKVADWRQPGEPLCPERVPLAVLQRIRTRLGSYWWNALYQQRPSPAEGLLFRKGWIQPPLPIAPGQPRRSAPLVLSCDLSFKDGKDNGACGFALLGLLEPQRDPAVEARRQGLALAANAAGAQGASRGVQVRFARKADSLVEELLAFSPRGGVDDQVDAFYHGVLWIEAQSWPGRGYGSSPVPMVFSR